MLGIDPPSFGGRRRGRRGGVGSNREVGGDEDEGKIVKTFLERWKSFDWTAELDGEICGKITTLQGVRI